MIQPNEDLELLNELRKPDDTWVGLAQFERIHRRARPVFPVGSSRRRARTSHKTSAGEKVRKKISGERSGAHKRRRKSIG